MATFDSAYFDPAVFDAGDAGSKSVYAAGIQDGVRLFVEYSPTTLLVTRVYCTSPDGRSQTFVAYLPDEGEKERTTFGQLAEIDCRLQLYRMKTDPESGALIPPWNIARY